MLLLELTFDTNCIFARKQGKFNSDVMIQNDLEILMISRDFFFAKFLSHWAKKLCLIAKYFKS